MKETYNNKENKREILPDVLKGFAIILVVFAHCIQEGSGIQYRELTKYFDDRLYQFIYSFHMPLFMLISGYLSWYSINKCHDKEEKCKLLMKRSTTLLFPIFMWTAVDYIRILVINHINGNKQPEALVFVYFYNAFQNLWFLWAVFWSFLVVFIVYHYIRYKKIVYLLLFLIMFIVPDGLGLGAYKYMMPYFILGFYFNNRKTTILQKIDVKRNAIIKILILLCIFILLFNLYDSNTLIYLSGYKLVGKNIKGQLATDILRFIIGIIGSLFFTLIIYLMVDFSIKSNNIFVKNIVKLLAHLGRESMGIYILSGYILIFVIQKIVPLNQIGYMYNLVEMIIVFIIANILTIIMGKIPGVCRLVGMTRRK